MRKKNILAILAVALAMVMAISVMTSVPVKAATYPYLARNSFDVYNSSNGRRLTTRRNSGAYMDALSRDYRSGVLIVSQEVRVKKSRFVTNTLRICHRYWWYMPSMRNNAPIYIYKDPPRNKIAILNRATAGRTFLGSGVIHMSSRGSSFFNAVKIDTLGGGKYLKYTY